MELSNADLVAGTQELVRRSRGVEADLLVYLGEIDERQLFLDRASSSMHEFCVKELGFSDDVAYSRITVARAARQLPGIVEVIRGGQVHLTGVRLLIPHLTFENHRSILARAAGKSKGEIEELVVTLAPRPPVPDAIRQVPAQAGLAVDVPATQCTLPESQRDEAPVVEESGSKPNNGGEPPARIAAANQKAARTVIAPLAQDAFKFQFTGSRALRDKVREAQALLRHRVPDGNLARIVEMALDLLIAQVKKERFAVGRKPRRRQPRRPEDIPVLGSRHIPDEYKRAVYERDEGRCTAVDETGRRCTSRDVEYDHINGFALDPVHSIDGIRLLCRAHNQHAAEKLYGREFMKRARAKKTSTRSGTSSNGAEERSSGTSFNGSEESCSETSSSAAEERTSVTSSNDSEEPRSGTSSNAPEERSFGTSSDGSEERLL
ncbi:MAG TPA: HNH endonuclease signature motif containing protein [Myxococcales bacterium]|nr:HNH endonuclease signature motif containing protein [Myxococcales bacterium]